MDDEVRHKFTISDLLQIFTEVEARLGEAAYILEVTLEDEQIRIGDLTIRQDFKANVFVIQTDRE